MEHLWPRVLALGAAAIVAAVLLKFAHPAIVLVVFVAALVGLYSTLKRSRESQRVEGTDLLGLRREAADPFRIVSLPLALLSRALDPSVEDASAGTWRGLEVQAFGVSFQPPPILGVQPERVAFSVAIAELEGAGGPLVVEPRLFRASLTDAPPEPAIETGDQAFDDSMVVWSGDEDFARGFLDPPVREWLQSLDLRWALEVRERLVAVYGPKPERPDLVSTLETLRDALDRLPGDRGRSPSAR
jgi:hypothetical protein